MSDKLSQLRTRIEQCRRLAKMITDPQAREALRRLADEGEADLRKLEAEEAAKMQIPPPQQT